MSLALSPVSMPPTSLTPQDVIRASTRIAPYIHRTPLLTSPLLNQWLGHELWFKTEAFQKIGAFKIRGALNSLLALQEQGQLPKQVVAFSSGNHAQAVALACRMLEVKATIIIPKFVSAVKQQATRGYGAEVVLTDTRQQAEALSLEYQAKGAYFIHPSDDDAVIAGQGTACLEALEDGATPDAIFATCGGGGWLAGTVLATKVLAPNTHVYGAEPAMANDAARSLRTGHIIGFEQTPMTIADGARTLHISERTFYFLKQLHGFYEVPERDICYWTQWLQHLLKIVVEPTSAVAMGAACQWLGTQTEKRRVLVMLSGGNIDAASERLIWQENHLEMIPTLI